MDQAAVATTGVNAGAAEADLASGFYCLVKARSVKARSYYGFMIDGSVWVNLLPRWYVSDHPQRAFNST